MIRLNSVTDKLQFKIDTAVTTTELSIVVSYSDKTESHYVGDTQCTTSTGTTIVDICSSPISPAIRDIDTITIFNSDTTSKLIYVYYLNPTSIYTIIAATLAVGDKLEYVHGNGWKTTDSTGSIKGPSGSGITTINTDATVTQTLTTGTTGTDFAIVDNGTGDHKFNIPDAGAAARGVVTTGAQTLAGAKTFSTAPILSSLTASEILALDASKNIQTLAVATYPSLTELSYVKGVTSSIQTQFTGKLATTTPLLISTPYFNWASAYSALDSTTLYFGDKATGAPNATATNRQFRLPTGVLRSISISTSVATILGTNEAVTINLRNITDATSTLVTNTLTWDNVSKGFITTGLAITTDSSKDYSWELVNPVFATNPTGITLGLNADIFNQ